LCSWHFAVYEDFVVVEVWGQVEEEVAAVEDDEVDHRGPVKIGGVLWVVSHNNNWNNLKVRVNTNISIFNK